MGPSIHTDKHMVIVPSLLSSRTSLFPGGSRGRLKMELEDRLTFSSVCSVGFSGTSWFRRNLRQQMEAASGSSAIRRPSGRSGSHKPAWQWKETQRMHKFLMCGWHKYLQYFYMKQCLKQSNSWSRNSLPWSYEIPSFTDVFKRSLHKPVTASPYRNTSFLGQTMVNPFHTKLLWWQYNYYTECLWEAMTNVTHKWHVTDTCNIGLKQ